MSVPKKKLSRTRTRTRRSHHGVDAPTSMKSPIAGDAGFIQPHHSHTFNGKLYTWKELKELMKKK